MYSFRNCQVAAPLKHYPPRWGAGVMAGLPQLSSCGPIEARSVCARRQWGTTFRNCQVAAPLKLLLVLVELALLGLPSATVKLRPH